MIRFIEKICEIISILGRLKGYEAKSDKIINNKAKSNYAKD